MRPTLKVQLLSLCVLLGTLSTAAQSGFAQADPPLNFGNNFFVTGDYIVAGAYNMNGNFVTINGQSYTVGTINVPDKSPGAKGIANPGITGATSVPPGGQIVAAFLYWQTVEKVSAPGSGQNGFFRSLMYAGNGGPAAPGYPISGANVSGSTAVSWSSGGCSGGSTGKILRTYRADVGAGLPVDANGNQVANGSFEIRLPSTSNNSTPLTLGATLVIIYRIPTGAGVPNIPLNAIVIYDGDYAQSSAQLTMTQQVPVFDADTNTVTRLTHIVGGGQSNKFQTVYLGQDANHLTKLPFLYGNRLPAFPGWYGAWDNVTWTLPGGTSPLPMDASSATTQVVPNPMNQGCVSWGAVIVSTTVRDPDHDAILYSWKNDPRGPGYCDVSLNASCSGPGDPAWIALTGAKSGQQDVFLHYDYMCSDVTGPGSCHIATVNDPLSAAATASGGKTTYTGTFSPPIPAGIVVGIDGFTKPSNNGQFTVVSATASQLVVNNPSGVAENPVNPGVAIYSTPGDGNYSFDPRLAVDYEDGKIVHDDAVDKVVASYGNNAHHSPIVLHAIPGNAIEENQPNVSCKDTDPTCPFPNEPGTVGFRDGLSYIKNTTIDPSTGLIGCNTSTDANCVAVFQHGKKDSYHYALFSHGVGLPSWFLSDPTSLQSVQQTGNIVTFTTKLPHGIAPIVAQPNSYALSNDSLCAAPKYAGRVTVVAAITNSNLNGTFCVLTSPAPTLTTFSISVGGSPTNFSYTAKTDPDLAVANGQVTSMSGYSDVGGQNSVISLGYGDWGPPSNALSDGNKWQDKAGTFMHELGHTMFLSHSGTFYNNLPNNANDFTPTFEANCKPNVQTSMSYLFQFDLLQVPGEVNASGKPQMVVDYSEDSAANTLTKSIPQAAGVLSSLPYANTASFQVVSSTGVTLTLSSVSAASGGSTVYTGAITGGGGNALAGSVFYVSGFTNAANNGTFYATASTTTTLTLSNPSGVAEAHAATAASALSSHCDGSPVLKTDRPMAYVPFSPASNFFWSNATGLDFNFDGNTTDVMHPHNEWEGTPAEGAVGPSPGVDLRQVSALGTITAVGPGGGGGKFPPGGGGGLFPPGGGGGKFPPGGGGGKYPPGGGGGRHEFTHEEANAYPRPPQDLTITQEEASPRYIDLSWLGPTFGTVVNYKIYRSVAGGPFALLNTVPGTQTTYTDTVTCNQGGYEYEVTAVINNDSGQPQESTPSNIVPATGQAFLTGCYTAPVAVAVEVSGVQGDIVPVTWTLTDDFYTTPPAPWSSATAGNPVTNQAANTLVAVGPNPTNGCAAGGRTTLLLSGVPQSVNGTPAGTFANSGDQFTFTLNTDVLCAGSYSFELDLDSGQKFTSSTLQLSIDVNDQDTPRITTLALPAGTVGLAYTDTLTEDGGTAPFTWNVTGLPSGISQQATGSPTISGTTCAAAASYAVNATVTDSASKPNSGTQAFTLQIAKANTTTSVMSSVNPSVFQQIVTFTVTVAPQYGCTPTGTVTLLDGQTQIGSMALPPNGTATFAFSGVSSLSVGMHTITATYGGDNSFNSSNGSLLPSPTQTVNRAQTEIVVNSVSPSTIFVGQPITVSYTLSVVPPGAGSPIAPTGSITVTASDGSACAPQPATSGMCTLSPAPAAAGSNTFTVTYSGDGNFFGTADPNVNYTIYQLVFTTQPSNTGVGNTITPAVQVTAEDSTGTTLTTFGGGITVAKGSGPGTLSGTLTQNAVAGVATFPDLSINKVATGDTLVASPAGGVPAATSNPFNITLALNYTQLQPTSPPAARCCVAMAFDPLSNSTLLFGGTVPGLGYAVVNDTWQLTNGQWAQLSPGISPPARSGAAMVYDAAHNNIVLFGGTTGSSDLNDTWIWDGSTWTATMPPASPPGRRFDSQGMAYDPNMQAVVMFGGIDYTSKIFYNDTWVWNGTTWTQMGSPASSPSARRSVLATDPSGNVMLFGGGGPSGAVLGDTWVWNGTNWNQQSPATSPAARDLHNMAFNPNIGAVVLFAGSGGFNDVWSWDGTTWTQVTPAAAAPQRYAFGMDYDGAANAIFVFGGFTTNGPAINDTWEFTVSP